MRQQIGLFKMYKIIIPLTNSNQVQDNNPVDKFKSGKLLIFRCKIEQQMLFPGDKNSPEG